MWFWFVLCVDSLPFVQATILELSRYRTLAPFARWGTLKSVDISYPEAQRYYRMLHISSCCSCNLHVCAFDCYCSTGFYLKWNDWLIDWLTDLGDTPLKTLSTPLKHVRRDRLYHLQRETTDLGRPAKVSITKHTHTHTHPFNGPFSRTTRVSRYQ